MTLALDRTTDWRARMNCIGADPDLFTYEANDDQHAEAEEICLTCRVFIMCDSDVTTRLRRGENVRGYFAGRLYGTGRRRGRSDETARRQRNGMTEAKRARNAARPSSVGEAFACAYPPCEGTFTRDRYSGKRRYCSRLCSERHLRELRNPPPVRTCAYRHCDATIRHADTRIKYCGDAHRRLETAARMRITRPHVCQYPPCGKPFDAKRDAHRYCSTACRNAMAKAVRDGNLARSRNEFEVVTGYCALPSCGKEFTAQYRHNKKYCCTKHQQAAYWIRRRGMAA